VIGVAAQIVSAFSVVIALGAVWVAVWQIRMNARQTERSNSLPVLAAAFEQYRSPAFRSEVDYLMRNVPAEVPAEGFGALPVEWRDNAYRVCYFFDHLGILVAHRMVDERVVVGAFATQAIQVWHVAEPFIRAERRHRADNYSPYASPGFLEYYEHLVQRVINLGGRDAPARIRAQVGTLTVAVPVHAAPRLPDTSSAPVGARVVDRADDGVAPGGPGADRL
jgi:hypothetical protein